MGLDELPEAGLGTLLGALLVTWVHVPQICEVHEIHGSERVSKCKIDDRISNGRKNRRASGCPYNKDQLYTSSNGLRSSPELLYDEALVGLNVVPD